LTFSACLFLFLTLHLARPFASSPLCSSSQPSLPVSSSSSPYIWLALSPPPPFAALVNLLCLSLPLPHPTSGSPFASSPSYQLLSTIFACLFLLLTLHLARPSPPPPLISSCQPSLPVSSSPFLLSLHLDLISASSSPPYLLLLKKVMYSRGKHFPSPIVGNSALRRGIIL
jgi:hypothetical protein